MRPGEKLLTVSPRLSGARNHFHQQGERTFHGDLKDCPLCRETIEQAGDSGKSGEPNTQVGLSVRTTEAERFLAHPVQADVSGSAQADSTPSPASPARLFGEELLD